MNGNHYRGKKRHGWVQSASENYLALFWLLGGSDFLSKGSKLEFIWQQDLIVNRDNLNKLSNSDILKKKICLSRSMTQDCIIQNNGKEG